MTDICNSQDYSDNNKQISQWLINHHTYRKHKVQITEECLNRNCNTVAVQGNILYFGRSTTSVLNIAGCHCFCIHIKGGPGFENSSVQTCTIMMLR